VARLGLLALLAIPFGWDGALHGQAGLQEVVSLRFEGNRVFPSEVLTNAIVTRETECRSPIFVFFCWAGADFSEDPYFFSPREFRRDQARIWGFYYLRGYRETTVDTILDRPSDEEVRITFRIDEGDPVLVEEIEYLGLEELSDSSLIRDLPIGVGDPLSGLALEAARDTLQNRLHNRSYAHADVLLSYFIPRETPHGAQVTFDLFAGSRTSFGPITVNGNVRVSEAVVRRMLPFREGDPYSLDRRFAGQRNLYNLDIFQYVDIVPQLEYLPDSIVPMTVQVAEGLARRVRTGSGLSTADCVNAEVRWSNGNFLGGARRLQLTGRVSNVLAPMLVGSLCPDAGTDQYGKLNWNLSADFNQPWVLSPRNSLSARLYGERVSLPDLFVRRTLGGALGFTRAVDASTPLTFSFRPQLSELSAAEIFYCSNYLVCDPEDIKILQEANWLIPLGLSFSRDRRNQALSPTRGYSALVDLEHADEWTGSEFRYTRLIGEATWYTHGRSQWVLAAKLRGGWVNPGGFRGLARPGVSRDIVHPDKRFYAGGANSVRGFAQNRLGPQVLQLTDVSPLLADTLADGSPLCTPESLTDLTCDPGSLPDSEFLPRPTGGTSFLEGSVEVRFPLSGQRWEGAAFADFGQVWGEGDAVRLGALELTPGVGVRFLSPIGPIRVDLGYRFAGGEQLQVVTSQVRPYDPDRDGPGARLSGPDGAPLDYVLSEELALLTPTVLWGEEGTWSLRRFQIHLSIGQAF
jgi:outer membrane protein insertion porin family/translocation and assembly module TamA